MRERREWVGGWGREWVGARESRRHRFVERLPAWLAAHNNAEALMPSLSRSVARSLARSLALMRLPAQKASRGVFCVVFHHSASNTPFSAPPSFFFDHAPP